MGYELGMRAQIGQLIGMSEQSENTIADEVSGGEIARDEKQVAGDDNLARRQAIAGLLGSDQQTDQITAAASTSRVDRADKIIVELLPGGVQLGRLLGCPSGVEHVCPRIGPALELRHVGGVDA